MGNAHKKLGLAGRKGGKEATKKTKGLKEGEGDNTEILRAILSKGDISSYYQVHENVLLGRGHYAIVNLGTDRRTGVKVAIKRIQISKSRVEALQREVEVLQKIGRHDNIVTLFDIFITDTELQLVLELLQGGELFDRMVERGPYSEKEASYHIRRIGKALAYLHEHGIVHRDLKPENLILASKAENSELKIADFGLSKIVDNVQNSTMQTVCGTWAYCAPEVKTSMKSVNNKGVACYTAAVDLWSVGVILFVILGAYHPFDPDGDATDAQLWDNICKGEFDFDDPAWENISGLAKDLIKRLIVVDPAKRYTTADLLSHPWIKEDGTNRVPDTPITPSIDKSLQQFGMKRGMTPRGGMGMHFGNMPPNLQQHYQMPAAPPHPQPTFQVPMAPEASQNANQPVQSQYAQEQQRNFQETMEVEESVGARFDNTDMCADPVPPLPSLTLNTLVVENDDSMDTTN